VGGGGEGREKKGYVVLITNIKITIA